VAVAGPAGAFVAVLRCVVPTVAMAVVLGVGLTVFTWVIGHVFLPDEQPASFADGLAQFRVAAALMSALYVVYLCAAVYLWLYVVAVAARTLCGASPWTPTAVVLAARGLLVWVVLVVLPAVALVVLGTMAAALGPAEAPDLGRVGALMRLVVGVGLLAYTAGAAAVCTATVARASAPDVTSGR